MSDVATDMAIEIGQLKAELARLREVERAAKKHLEWCGGKMGPDTLTELQTALSIGEKEGEQ